MLAFIRKRLPSKDRSNEHLHNVKLNHNQHGYQPNGDQMKKSESSNDLNVNNNNENKKKKKKKNKERSSLNQDELIISSNAPPIVNRINISYSDVDYFPMMPGALSQSVNHDKESINRDSLTDCYLNPSESIQTTHNINYRERSQIQSRVFQIPVIDCRQEQWISDYKDVDHQRTKALRDVTEQRREKRVFD
ncbi:unnamed protein product [Rotaria sp. Silwood1]|nr:unnamed protein product [Rotaria sp. Silwood1]CAF3581031.1 unnamed protein product [Rotaria sp. Silwood1]